MDPSLKIDFYHKGRDFEKEEDLVKILRNKTNKD